MTLDRGPGRKVWASPSDTFWNFARSLRNASMTSMTAALSRRTVLTANRLLRLYRSTSMKSLTSLRTVSLMFASGAVFAHEPKAPQSQPAEVMEVTDHIMMDIAHMTPAAHEKMAMDQFARFDANSDGMLSKAEFVRPRGK
jgi:hypothetical protein